MAESPKIPMVVWPFIPNPDEDLDVRSYLLRRRQALLMELGAIEEALGLPRSVIPKRKRQDRNQPQSPCKK